MGSIGDLFINIHANARGLVSGLAHSQKKLRKFSRQTARMGRQMQTLSRGMASLGVAMAAPIAIGIREFAKFEKSMANVSTMLDRPTKHMAAFNSGVSRMAVEFGESTETLAGGLYDILSASIAPEKAMETLRVAAMAATAGVTDTKTAADVLTTVLNSYGLAASDASHVSDMLFTIVKRGKTTFEELAAGMGTSSSLAASTGISFEELGATVAALTRNGVKTEVAMTAINAVISSFTKATDGSRQAVEDLGLDLELTARALGESGLLGAMQKLAAVDPDNLAQIFPNMRAIRGVLPVLQDLRGFASDLEALHDPLGATSVAFEKLAKTSAKKFASAKEAALSLARAIGEVLTGETSDLARQIKELAQRLERWVRVNGDLVRDIAAAIPKLAALTAGIWAASVALRAVAASTAIAASAGGAASTAFGKMGRFLGTAGLIYVGALVAAKGLRALGESLGLLPERMAEVKRAAESLALDAGDLIIDPKAGLGAKQKAVEQALAANRELLRRLADQKQAVLNMQSGFFRAPLTWISEAIGDVYGLGQIDFDSVGQVEAEIRRAQKQAEELRKQLRDVEAAARGAAPGEEVFQQFQASEAASRGWLKAGKHAMSVLGGLALEFTDAAGAAWEAHMLRMQQGAAKMRSDLVKQGRQLTMSLETPAEKFAASIKQAETLLAAGVITPEVYDRAVARAHEDLAATKPPQRSPQAGSIQTAIGTFKFGPNNRTQQVVATNSVIQTKHQQTIAANTAATASAIKGLGPSP